MIQLNWSSLTEFYQFDFVKTLGKKYPKAGSVFDNWNQEMLHIDHLTVTALSMDRHWNTQGVPAFLNPSANM